MVVRQTTTQGMRRGSGLTILVVTCATVLGVLAPASVAQPRFEQPTLVEPVEGTWILKIHRVTQGIDFTSLQSFTAGGVVLATGTIDRTPPPPISPLYGSWRRLEPNQYAATLCFFAFDPTGKAVAMIKTNETVRLIDINTISGSGTGFACDLNGDNCVNAGISITFTGKRVVAQPASD